jgi:eukaryotic-like serine/threonine-protein kinase
MPNPGGLPVYPDHAASAPVVAVTSSAPPGPAHHPDHPHYPGELIDGRYRLERGLGEGARTETWEATHLELACAVAIKFLRESPQLHAASHADELLDVARAIAKVHHPHVVEQRDLGRLSSGAPFLVMELLAGETLEQLLSRRGCVAWARAVRIIEQIAAALAAAHHEGVIHADLRPGNVFLVDTEQAGDFVKIVDFGLAGRAWGGTPDYMSPEQRRGEPLDPRADIYAIGCLIHALITGQAPSAKDAAKPKPLKERAPRQFIPEELEVVAARCLEQLPARRFADTRELIAALSELTSFATVASVAGGVDPNKAGARPMGYAGQRAPQDPPEPIADRPKPKHEPKPNQRDQRSGASVRAVIGIGLASSLGIAGVGLGVWWLVARLIAAAPTRSAEPAERVAAPATEASASPAASNASKPLATTSEHAEPLERHAAPEPPEQSEHQDAATIAATDRDASAVVPEATKPTKPSDPESDPEPAEQPASNEKPSIKPDSKANEGIAHDDLVDPWQ